MHQTNKTPAGVAGHAGASRDSFGGTSQSPFTVEAYRAQFLTLAYAMRPELAVMIAALAFGGGNG